MPKEPWKALAIAREAIEPHQGRGFQLAESQKS